MKRYEVIEYIPGEFSRRGYSTDNRADAEREYAHVAGKTAGYVILYATGRQPEVIHDSRPVLERDYTNTCTDEDGAPVRQPPPRMYFHARYQEEVTA